MTDWRLEALRRQLRDAKAERDHLDQQAERAERIGIPELAARYRIGREEPHFRAFTCRPHWMSRPRGICTSVKD